RGFAVSPGRVTAPASVILSPADFDKMVPDTILVCPTTTPAWTPLLSQARGLVTDIGGVTAHGSIVAREYGIPAVMGTGNGTCRIRNRQMVAVDGEAGNVTLLDEVGGEGGTAIETRASQEGRRAMSAWLALRTALLAGTAIGIAIYWRRRSKSAPNWNRRG
ncbi:MAG: PEP-utilizing enzyme, partial [Chloroflexota bacterium]